MIQLSLILIGRCLSTILSHLSLLDSLMSGPSKDETDGPNDLEKILQAGSCSDMADTDGNCRPQPSLWRRWRIKFAIELPFFLFFMLMLGDVFITNQFVYFVFSNGTYQQYSDDKNGSCSVNKSDASYKFRQTVQSETSVFFLKLSFASAIPALFSTSIVPTLSDRFGRRTLLLVPACGYLFNIIIWSLICWLNWPLWLAYLGKVVNGVSGYYGAFLALSFAYLSDVTTLGPERTCRVAVLEAIGALGSVITSLLLGYLLNLIGYKWSFVVLSSLSLLNIFSIVILVPNKNCSTIAGPADQRLSVADVFCHSLVSPWTLYFDSTLRFRRHLRLLLVLFCLIVGPLMFTSDIETLFMMDDPLCFKAIEVGYYKAFNLVFCVLSIVICIPLLFRLLRLSPMDVICIACVSGCAASIYRTFVQTRPMMFSVPIVQGFSFMAAPVIRSTMSKLVDVDSQGTLYASLGVVQNICSLAFSPSFNAIYAATVDTLAFSHGFAFLVQAGMLLIPTAIALYSTVYSRSRGQSLGQSRSQAPLLETASVQSDDSG